MSTISHLTREFVKSPVEATLNGLPVDPRSAPVAMAFTAPGVDPVAGDWTPATWASENGAWNARVLLRPNGDIALQPEGEALVPSRHE